MNKAILKSDIQKFIDKNLNGDLNKLALQKNPFPDVEWAAVLNQIACKFKAQYKLPTYFATQNIIYPSKISLEQTSSEKTAQYKSTLVSGNSLIDVTGGFGVDAFFFANHIKFVTHCEIDFELSEIVRHNYELLNPTYIETICGDGIAILKSKNRYYDCIYIDPSRRNNVKGKVFLLNDCLPNVPQLLADYFKFTNNVLVKTSPMLDISVGLSELLHVKAIHIVAVDNEVKELLWIIEKNYNDLITIFTANIITNNTVRFSFKLNNNVKRTPENYPLQYLYEPNAAIMKSGGFDEVATQFNLCKLHQNSHLYTSNHMIEFPGRTFEILQNFDYTKSNMLSFFKNTKANITTRNFSETVADIRKKWKISDGGDIYSFFTTNMDDKKIVLVCKKIIFKY